MKLTATEIKTIIENICEEFNLTNVKIKTSAKLKSSWTSSYNHTNSISTYTINSTGIDLIKEDFIHTYWTDSSEDVNIEMYTNDFNDMIKSLLNKINNMLSTKGLVVNCKEYISHIRNNIVLLHKLEMLSK